MSRRWLVIMAAALATGAATSARAAADPQIPLPAPTRAFRSSAHTRLTAVLGDYPWRHNAEINAMSFSPDGRLALTAGSVITGSSCGTRPAARIWRTFPGVKGGSTRRPSRPTAR